MRLPNAGLTILIAHPDDEIIFMWWALKKAKKIICCSSDLYNPDRQWCANRKEALKDICKMLGIEMVCFDYNSEFYRVNARHDELRKLQLRIGEHLTDSICTHNAWGEYGHIDHILVNQFAMASNKKIFVSDISLYANWFQAKLFKQGEEIGEVENDIGLYNKCKGIYDHYGCWTWSKPPIEVARIYEICNSAL
jgi:LmbE family N-acetylglucosaminyl deacetylase